MKGLRSLLTVSMMIAGFLLAGTGAKANSLTINLTSPFQAASPGAVIAFDATVINTSGNTVDLAGDNSNLDAPLVLDDSPFNNNWPLSLGAGDSYTGLLFNADIPSLTPYGLYTGVFEITDQNNNVVGSADFDVQVAPEPSSLLLLGTALLALGVFARRKLVARKFHCQYSRM